MLNLISHLNKSTEYLLPKCIEKFGNFTGCVITALMITSLFILGTFPGLLMFFLYLIITPLVLLKFNLSYGLGLIFPFIFIFINLLICLIKSRNIKIS